MTTTSDITGTTGSAESSTVIRYVYRFPGDSVPNLQLVPPTDYFFYIYDKYREIPIIERKHEDYKSVYWMENGDTISLWKEDHYGHLYKRSYQIESTAIAINDIRIEEFFVPINTIPPECIQTDESELKVYCLPEYYLSYPHPYKHAYDFPLHLIEHLPIQSYDPPYVILDSSVKNTPFGIYFD